VAVFVALITETWLASRARVAATVAGPATPAGSPS
jgi:hypothetical protein